MPGKQVIGIFADFRREGMFRAPGLQAESNFVGNLGLPIFIKRRSKRSTLSFLNK